MGVSELLPDFFNITAPDYQKYRSPWFDKKCKEFENEPMKVAQELQIQYVATGSSRFGADVLELAGNTIRSPLWKGQFVGEGTGTAISPSDDGPFLVFSWPKPKHRYVVGADTAAGHVTAPGEHHSKTAFVVLDTSNWPTGEVVATFSFSQLDPARFAYILAWVCTEYNGAYLVPENKGPGVATLEVLCKLPTGPVYPFVYRTRTSSQDFIPGFVTSSANRPILEQVIGEHLASDRILDKRLLDELGTFVWAMNGATLRGQAERGCNDDMVISYGLVLVGGKQHNGIDQV